MSQDLEIDELTRKISSLEDRFQNRIKPNKPTRQEFDGLNTKRKDMFISMNDENQYREFEQWLLMKTI